LKQYKGAVFFVDLLGIGALTKKQLKLTNVDYTAFNLSKNQETEQFLCAKLLMNFRKILRSLKSSHPSVEVAQLSDCAFIWSKDVLAVMNAACDLMWHSTRQGLLCRGGLAYGEIVEPDKVGKSIGQFIVGEAVTKAVELESLGKGCRIFSDIEFPTQLSKSNPSLQLLFSPIKNPLNGTIVDEYKWYMHQKLTLPLFSSSEDKKKAAIDLIELVTLLKHSTKFNWNASSKEGEIHLAVSIETISTATKLFIPTLDYCFNAEYLFGHLTNHRKNSLQEKFYAQYKQQIEHMHL